MKRNGFTLVELLAVITIIALLFSIAALKMGNSSTKRKEEDYFSFPYVLVSSYL